MSDASGLPKLKASPGGSLSSLGCPKEFIENSNEPNHVGRTQVKNLVLAFKEALNERWEHGIDHVTKTSHRQMKGCFFKK